MEISLYLGIDVGSTTVKVVLVDETNQILDHAYLWAHGQPGSVLWKTLKRWTRRWDLQRIEAIGLTGSGGELLAPLVGGLHVNELIAQTRALDTVAPRARTAIEMGGQDSKLLILKRDLDTGSLLLVDFAMNTLCAAGTGSFLEQQAERLGVSLKEFASLALQSDNPVRIAGRCTVFAKSDMIHLQQQGVPTPDIIAGLCLAVARNFRSIVGRGKPFHLPILFQGGVAHNAGMVWAFERVLGLERGSLIVPPHCTLLAARGAALTARARTGESSPFRELPPLDEFLAVAGHRSKFLPPLGTRGEAESCRPALPPEGGTALSAYLGVDVGSISTKVVLVDDRGRVLSRCYLYNFGRPLETVQQGLRQVANEVGERVRVRAAGVTGSGRYLVGDYIGADLVRNEISAQARAALAFDPQVDTVFEIGGQDSKYIRVREGVVVDFVMNKACAAGTGSFLEEQAQRLRLTVEELGPLALAAPSPVDLGERCTVFMESDLIHHQQRGARRENLVAGLAYSIARNYLNRVVHNRPIGRQILFVGGVASNPAVVAAFEQILGLPVAVPPHHKFSGAIGAALLTIEESKRQPAEEPPPSRFVGFDRLPRSYQSSTFVCKGCPNRCEIQRVTVAGEKTPFFYGARCERYEGSRARKAGVAIPDLFAEREEMLLRSIREQAPSSGKPRVGIPRTLFFYELLPLWARLFQELDWEVVLSPPTTPQIASRSATGAIAETCFPVKLVYGHVTALLEEGVDRVFIPSIINRRERLPGQRESCECPYVQATPHLIEAALRSAGQPTPLLQLPIDLLRKNVLGQNLHTLARQLGVSLRELKRAWRQAEEEQRCFESACKKRGQEVLAGLGADAYGAVLVGRPYNTADPVINVGLPQKLRRLGVLALPIDFLSLDGTDISDIAPDMFWHSGQRILAAAKLIRKDPRLQAIYVTNFGCGPDSFLLSFFRQAMQGEPFLELEVDDHSADTGLVTRCEAFFDSLRVRGGRPAHSPQTPAAMRLDPSGNKLVVGPGRTGPAGENEPEVCTRAPGNAERKVYIPCMCDHAYALAAAMRFHGIEAEVLPPPDEETLAIGRNLCLGRECLPCFTSVGDIVRQTQQAGFEPTASAYLMPTSEGPCRFGQSHHLQRQILDRLGFHKMKLLSPSSENAYMGFGDRPLQLRRLAWQGIVGVDLLQKLLHEHRPYERSPGTTDHLYRDLLRKLIQAIETGGGRPAAAVLREAARRFTQLGADRRKERPIIGVVGEIYVRANAFTNQEIARQIEALGGEAWIAPITEWFYFVNHTQQIRAAAAGHYGDLLNVILVDRVQRLDERRMLRLVASLLRNRYEPTISTLARFARPYYDPILDTEAVPTLGKAVHFACRGLDGILNLMPFTCMPGNIVAGLSQRVRADYGQIPWLDVVYDSQGETNLGTRLEAFLYQARQFQQKPRRRDEGCSSG